jgi:hypothetical protein
VTGFPGVEFMRLGEKMLLYLEGSDFDAGGDLVFPTSKALSVSASVSPVGGDATVFPFGVLGGAILAE